MAQSLIDRSVSQFVGELASGDPTPGGGAGAALAGALGAALLVMVCRFTVGREKFAQVEAQVQGILAEAEAARGRFLLAVDADAEAYGAVAAAYGLPRGTDEERAQRSAAIRQASWLAAKPPLSVAEEGARLVELCAQARDITNPMLGSDVTTAVALARAAIEGGAANVEANLSGLGEDQAEVLRARLAAVRQRGS